MKIVFAGALFLLAANASAQTLEGTWRAASGNVDVAIAPCGKALCGDVVRVLGNASMEALGAPSKAPPPRLGLRIFSSLTPRGAIWRGKIFNRENGRTYDCELRPRDGATLEVRPYILIPLFGQTQIWRRAPVQP